MGFQFAGKINSAKVHIFVTKMMSCRVSMIYAELFEISYSRIYNNSSHFNDTVYYSVFQYKAMEFWDTDN